MTLMLVLFKLVRQLYLSIYIVGDDVVGCRYNCFCFTYYISVFMGMQRIFLFKMIFMILCMLSKLYLCLFWYICQNFYFFGFQFSVFLFFWRGCGWFGSHCWSPAISGGQSCPHSSANYLLLLKLPIFHYFNRSRKHIAKTYLESQKLADFPKTWVV